MIAMGGKAKLESIQNVQLDVIGHTELVEQSYRQAPYFSSYERNQETVDFKNSRISEIQHNVWPESDPKGAESDAKLVVTSAGGAYIYPNGSAPAGASDLDSAKEALELGPERLLMTAASSSDLHFEADEVIRSTPHTVLAFAWNGITTRILINKFTGLPDAVDTIRQFRDFWYFWGDVHQRIYWDNWKLLHGIVYPTSQITERNGMALSSIQVLDMDVNQPLNENQFKMSSKAAALSAEDNGWIQTFSPQDATQLAPGITLFRNSWNATIIKQDDGVVVLETPISGCFTRGIFDEANKLYPDLKIKAVLSTSDSWPHVGGIRYDVAQAVPVYVLDLNEPLVDRMVSAPHSLDPDELQQAPQKPNWRIVSEKTAVGTGQNRVVLYPLRGASTERQYMAFFPEQHLLYASDTLVINSDGTLYNPELVAEVKSVVQREHLDVATIFGMHQSAVPWKQVLSLLPER